MIILHYFITTNRSTSLDIKTNIFVEKHLFFDMCNLDYLTVATFVKYTIGIFSTRLYLCSSFINKHFNYYLYVLL